MDSYSAVTPSGQCGSIWTFHQNRSGVSGAVRSALRRTRRSSRPALGTAVAGILVASLACSSIAPASVTSYSSPEGTSPAIYIQQGETENVAQALQEYVSGTVTTNPEQNEGQLLAMNVDHLSSSVGPVGLSQSARVASLSQKDIATALPTSSQPASSAASGVDQNAVPFLADSGDDSSSDDDQVAGGSTLNTGTVLVSATFTGSSATTSPSPIADEDDGDEGEDAPVLTGASPFNSSVGGDGSTDGSASEPDDVADDIDADENEDEDASVGQSALVLNSTLVVEHDDDSGQIVPKSQNDRISGDQGSADETVPELDLVTDDVDEDESDDGSGDDEVISEPIVEPDDDVGTNEEDEVVVEEVVVPEPVVESNDDAGTDEEDEAVVEEEVIPEPVVVTDDDDDDDDD